MKLFSTLIFSLSLFTLSAQSVAYTVECPKQDSCYLVETTVGQATPPMRPQVTIAYRFFRSDAEFDAIVEQIRRAANAEISAGVDRSRGMNAIADKIAAAKPK